MMLPARFASRLTPVAFWLACLMPLWLALERVPMEVSTGCIAVFFLLYSYSVRDWRWLCTTEMRWLLLVWFYLMLNTLLHLGEVEAKQFLQSVLWVRFILLYAALRFWLLGSHAQRTRLAQVVLVTLTLLMLDGLYQYLTGFSLSGHQMSLKGRLTGIMQHSNIGNLLLKTMLVALGYGLDRALKAGRRSQAWGFFLWGLALCAFIPLTAERATTILLMISLCTLLGAFFIMQPQWRIRIFCVFLCVVALGMLIGMTQTNVQKRAVFFQEQIQDFSNTPYGQLYQAAWVIWRDHPWLGVGRKQFYDACLAVQQNAGLTYCDIHPHNIYLQWLAEQGGIGFMLFLLALATLCRQGWREGRAQLAQGSVVPFFSLAAMVVLLFPVMVTQNMFSNWPGVLFWYSLGLAMAMMAAEPEKRHAL